VVAAALVVVVGVGVTLAVVFWPGYRSLDYRPLAKAVTIAPGAPMSSGFQDSVVIGDRAYFASVTDSGTLEVVAADADTGERLWGSVEAGTAERWERMVAVPGAVVVFTDSDSTTSKLRMAVLDAGSGDLRWQRTIDDRDGVLFSSGVAVLVDRAENRLLGLDLTDGIRRWEEPDVKTGSGTTTAVIGVTTPADLSGPAAVSGDAFAPDPDDDTRIVQINADKSFRVLDATTGDVKVPLRQGTAGPDDVKIAHNGRLIVRQDGTTESLLAYDLDQPGEPEVLYSAPVDARISELTACGPDRVCWVETAGFEIAKTRVSSVNAAEGGGVWHRDLPNTDSLVPVGDHVMAGQNTSPPTFSVLDARGEQVWNAEGRAARLDGGNVLRFNRALSTIPDDPTVYGVHVGDEAVPLGALSNVRSQTCSWNTSVIACVGDENFVLQRFTD
jgi:hypothetical protein